MTLGTVQAFCRGVEFVGGLPMTKERSTASRALVLSAALTFLALVSLARADEPLQAAAQQGNLAVVQELLARGAAVNVPRPDGQTPLHLAAANGHTEIV